MAYTAASEDTSSEWRVTLGLYRNVLAIVGALTLLQGAAAALSVVIALGLAAAGTSNAALGLVAAFYAGGFLTGAILSPMQIARIGHIRSFAFFANSFFASRRRCRVWIAVAAFASFASIFF